MRDLHAYGRITVDWNIVNRIHVVQLLGCKDSCVEFVCYQQYRLRIIGKAGRKEITGHRY